MAGLARRRPLRPPAAHLRVGGARAGGASVGGGVLRALGGK